MQKIIALSILIGVVPTAYAASYDTWDEVRYHDVVEQGLDNSCGFASLLTITRNHYGDLRHTEKSLLEKYVNSASDKMLADAMQKGFSLSELALVAEDLGYKTMKKLVSYESLQRVSRIVPVMVYLEIGKNKHFAVVRRTYAQSVELIDPSRGNIHYSKDAFLREWKMVPGQEARGGIALLVFGNTPDDGGLFRL